MTREEYNKLSAQQHVTTDKLEAMLYPNIPYIEVKED